MVDEPGRQFKFSIPTAWGRLALNLLLIAGVVAVGYLLFERYFRMAATILLLASLLAYVLRPAVERLARFSRIPNLHTARMTATAVVYLAVAGMLLTMGIAAADTVTRDIGAVRASWVYAQRHLPEQLVRARGIYEVRVPGSIRASVDACVAREMKRLPDKHIPMVVSSLFGFVGKAWKQMGMLVELVFVPLIAFYLLTDAERVGQQALEFVPRRRREGVLRYATGIDRILREYMRGQIILCLIAWAVVTVGLLSMGIPAALLLGVFAGVSRGIPVFGPVIGGIPVMAAVLFDPQWSPYFWVILAAFALLHLIESKVVMPRILGDHLGVHPVIIILSLIVGYEVLGLLGMFLAPPAIAIIRHVLLLRRANDESTSAQPTLPGLDIPSTGAFSA